MSRQNYSQEVKERLLVASRKELDRLKELTTHLKYLRDHQEATSKNPTPNNLSLFRLKDENTIVVLIGDMSWENPKHKKATTVFVNSYIREYLANNININADTLILLVGEKGGGCYIEEASNFIKDVLPRNSQKIILINEPFHLDKETYLDQETHKFFNTFTLLRQRLFSSSGFRYRLLSLNPNSSTKILNSKVSAKTLYKPISERTDKKIFEYFALEKEIATKDESEATT